MLARTIPIIGLLICVFPVFLGCNGLFTRLEDAGRVDAGDDADLDVVRRDADDGDVSQDSDDSDVEREDVELDADSDADDDTGDSDLDGDDAEPVGCRPLSTLTCGGATPGTLSVEEVTTNLLQDYGAACVWDEPSLVGPESTYNFFYDIGPDSMIVNATITILCHEIGVVTLLALDGTSEVCEPDRCLHVEERTPI